MSTSSQVLISSIKKSLLCLVFWDLFFFFIPVSSFSMMISHSFGFIDMICSSFFLLLLLDLLITKIHTRNGATEILYQRFVFIYVYIVSGKD